MNKTEQVLKVCKDDVVFNVEWVIDRDAPIESIEAVLCSVLETAIKAAKDEGASDEEALNMIGFASLQAVKDAGIAGKVDAFVVSKKAKKENEE